MSSSSRPCPSCHRQLCLPANFTGQKVRCPACGAVFQASAYRTDEIVAFAREAGTTAAADPIAEISSTPIEPFLALAPANPNPSRNRGLAYLAFGVIALLVTGTVAWTVWLRQAASPSATPANASAVVSKSSLSPAPSPARPREHRQAAPRKAQEQPAPKTPQEAPDGAPSNDKVASLPDAERRRIHAEIVKAIAERPKEEPLSKPATFTEREYGLALYRARQWREYLESRPGLYLAWARLSRGEAGWTAPQKVVQVL